MLVDRRGHITARAVSCLPFIAEARVRYQVSPFEICGEQSGIGTGFFSEDLGFSL
jgi:hypothetical protein